MLTTSHGARVFIITVWTLPPRRRFWISAAFLRQRSKRSIKGSLEHFHVHLTEEDFNFNEGRRELSRGLLRDICP